MSSMLFEAGEEAALVTGAGNGIGRAIAQALVAEGVRTVFADIDPARVDAAIAASARPDLATGWVGDLASFFEVGNIELVRFYALYGLQSKYHRCRVARAGEVCKHAVDLVGSGGEEIANRS